MSTDPAPHPAPHPTPLPWTPCPPHACCPASLPPILGGAFGKPYSYAFGEVPFHIRELFWSSSVRGAVRGMHFQAPPKPATKLVWVSRGVLHDVCVDVRPGPTFGQVAKFRLASDDGHALLVPVGFAHGFQALSDDVIVNYAQDYEFDPAGDGGVSWRSCDFEWPEPVTVTSPRDEALPSLVDLVSPFSGTEL